MGASVVPLLEVAVSLRPGGQRRDLLSWFFVVFVRFGDRIAIKGLVLIRRIDVEVGALRIWIPLQAIDLLSCLTRQPFVLAAVTLRLILSFCHTPRKCNGRTKAEGRRQKAAGSRQKEDQ